jgi:hypothetical protein
LFAHEENKPFHFMHCWHQLKGEPKWESICQGTSFRGLHGKSIGSSGTPSVGGHESDSGSTGLTGNGHVVMILVNLREIKLCHHHRRNT